MGHGYNTDDYIQLNDAIKSLIKRGRLSEYIQGSKQDREGSPKTKSPMRAPEFGHGVEKGKTRKGKHLYISAIIRGAPCVKPPL